MLDLGDIVMDCNHSTMSKPIIHQNQNKLQVPVLKRHNHGNMRACCKKSKGKETSEESSSSSVSVRWENLDPNILREIFGRLPVVELFISVSSVCKSWEATCWELLFWSHKVLDMSATGAVFGLVKMTTVELLDALPPNRAPGLFGKFDSQEMYDNMAVTLMRKLRRIMETEIPYRSPLQSWKMSLTTVIFPYDLEISDTHLFYIAQRTPCVGQLLLLCTAKITSAGLIEALKCWKHLRGIHIGPTKDEILFAQFMYGIGANCVEIESLHIHEDGFLLDMERAQVIAQNLPGLKYLELDTVVIKASGMTTLYNKCQQLEEVYINRCRRVGDIDHTYIEYERAKVDHFRLTWMVDNRGFTIWQVTPCLPYTERICDFLLKDVSFMKFLSTPHCLASLKADLEPAVDDWLLHAYTHALRPGEQSRLYESHYKQVFNLI